MGRLVATAKRLPSNQAKRDDRTPKQPLPSTMKKLLVVLFLLVSPAAFLAFFGLRPILPKASSSDSKVEAHSVTDGKVSLGLLKSKTDKEMVLRSATDVEVHVPAAKVERLADRCRSR